MMSAGYLKVVNVQTQSYLERLIKKAALATYISMYSGALTPELGIPKLQEYRTEFAYFCFTFWYGYGYAHGITIPGGDNLEKALSSNAPTLLPMRAKVL